MRGFPRRRLELCTPTWRWEKHNNSMLSFIIGMRPLRNTPLDHVLLVHFQAVSADESAISNLDCFNDG